MVDLPYVPWAASVVALPAATAWGLSETRRGAAARLRVLGGAAAVRTGQVVFVASLGMSYRDDDRYRERDRDRDRRDDRDRS